MGLVSFVFMLWGTQNKRNITRGGDKHFSFSTFCKLEIYIYLLFVDLYSFKCY